MTTQELYDNCSIRHECLGVVAWAAKLIIKNRKRYEVVEAATGVPWYLVGGIHMREASFRFDTHLANGEPLFDEQGTPIKTRHKVPKGFGPFSTWEEGAIAALKRKNLHLVTDWTMGPALDFIEAFNGLGYRKKGMRSPYIWGATNMQQRGKYTRDHVFDPTKMDEQIGVAAVVKKITTVLG